MMKQIKQNIADCESIIEHIRKSINDGKCDNCLRCMELTNLYHALNKLSISVKSKFPTEAQFLQAYIPALIGVSHINPYDFGGIIAIVNIVKTKCKLMNDKQRNIFISHSSKDRAIVQPFIDDILQLGIGIKPEQIFCTSIEDMGIKNGEDIRKHIHQNIKDSEFSFLLISNNYKNSEICLNEMGAVWAYDSNVKLYLLPTTSIDNIGWLCNVFG